MRIAVVPTRDRPDDFADCARAIAPQVDALLVVAHGDPARHYVLDVLEYLDLAGLLTGCQILPYDSDPPNISNMWNLGLDSAPYAAGGNPYSVAVLNDDAIVPPDWFERIVTEMKYHGAAAGCARRTHDDRMAGYAFVLDGEKGLRADEQFQWWYGDDDLQRRAEQAGGVVYVGGLDVEHRHPNSTTVGLLADIAEADRLRFMRKWA